MLWAAVDVKVELLPPQTPRVEEGGMQYRGVKEWDNEKGYLTDICLTVQDKYKAYLDYFRIAY